MISPLDKGRGGFVGCDSCNEVVRSDSWTVRMGADVNMYELTASSVPVFVIADSFRHVGAHKSRMDNADYHTFLLQVQTK